MIEIECDFDDFNSGNTMSLYEEHWIELEEQFYAQMLGWA